MLPAEIEKVEEWEGDGVVVRCKITIAIMEGGLAPRAAGRCDCLEE